MVPRAAIPGRGQSSEIGKNSKGNSELDNFRSMITYEVGAIRAKVFQKRAKISSACHALGRAIAGVSLSMRGEWQI